MWRGLLYPSAICAFVTLACVNMTSPVAGIGITLKQQTIQSSNMECDFMSLEGSKHMRHKKDGKEPKAYFRFAFFLRCFSRIPTKSPTLTGWVLPRLKIRNCAFFLFFPSLPVLGSAVSKEATQPLTISSIKVKSRANSSPWGPWKILMGCNFANIKLQKQCASTIANFLGSARKILIAYLALHNIPGEREIGHVWPSPRTINCEKPAHGSNLTLLSNYSQKDN